MTGLLPNICEWASNIGSDGGPSPSQIQMLFESFGH